MESNALAAKANGERFFFTGKPCKHGHVANRYVHKGGCVICAQLARRPVQDPISAMYNSALKRSRDLGILFAISRSDIRAVWPVDGRCPALGLRLQRRHPGKGGKGGPQPASPTLDRIRPERGYVPGNIAVISHRANILKGNSTNPTEFRKLANWLAKALVSTV